MNLANRILIKAGLKAPPPPPPEHFPYGYGDEEIATYREAKPFTMTGKDRVLGLIMALRHIERHQIPGDIVECGVWRGGSMMVAARTLMNLGRQDRVLHLFDTYSGMAPPTAEDIGPKGGAAAAVYEKRKFADKDGSDWCYASLDDVRANVLGTGYPPGNVRFVMGKVEDTLPGSAPERVALLRLDTDWYESTRSEMEVLFPRLSEGGVIIVDDYLYWRGSRQAVDEYVARHGIRLLLVPLDGGGVMGVKERA